jgi:adenylate kinase
VRIVMLGPPASGKGTQSVRLAAEFGVPHVSSGRLLRESIEAGDPLGVADIVSSGGLVPDEIVEELLWPALGDAFVLDGYPRTEKQAVRLDDELAAVRRPLHAAVEIALDEKVLEQRMERRARLENRPDDRPDAFARRVEEYLTEAPALRAHYGERLVVVDGSGTPDEVYARLVAALGEAGVLLAR